MMSVSSMTAQTLKVIGSNSASGFFLLLLLSFNLCNAPVPNVERGRERRCQTEQLPLEWLGEVKAPTTLASRRPRLFWAVAASAPGMAVAFLYNEINRATHGFMPPLHKRSAHLDMQLAFCPFWAAFLCCAFDAAARSPIVTHPSSPDTGWNKRPQRRPTLAQVG